MTVLGERLFLQGNIAAGWGALYANCQAFFGYPITPQNETTEWFAKEFPARGRVFVQSASEVGTINMMLGAGAAGVRVMTSTSSPGWSLMQETMSHMSNAEAPAVIVLVQRGGPGGGHTRQAQMDYDSVTKGGGHGGYKNIVLAPTSVQENADLVQLAFHLADKYRNPVIVLTDALVGQTYAMVSLEKIDYGQEPEKDWALKGSANHSDGKHRMVNTNQGTAPNPPYKTWYDLVSALNDKFQAISEAEVRWEDYMVDDAEIILVSFGYTASVCKEAVNVARLEGFKAGLIRPVTVWPFPYATIKERAIPENKFLVVEDNLGQMVNDVRLAVEGRSEIHFLGTLARKPQSDAGLILPSRVLQEIKSLSQKGR